MLGLQAESRAKAIRLVAFAVGTIKKIAAVKLYAWLVGQNFKDSATLRIVGFCGDEKLGRAAFAVKHPVVVIAFSKFELLVVVADAGANGEGFQEIEGSILDFEISPVGMRVASTGVKCLAFSFS